MTAPSHAHTLVALQRTRSADHAWALHVAGPALLAALDPSVALPLLPATAQQLTRLLRRTDLSLAGVVALANRDPLLAATLLRAANAGRAPTAPAPATTIRDAILRLGRGRLRAALADAAAAPLETSTPVLAARVQLRANAVAVAASQIARLRGEDAEVAFMAGLLHDLGHAAVHAVVARPGVVLPEELHDPRLAALTGEVLHEALGGRLAAAWGFPEPLVAAIRHHHRPADAGAHVGTARIVAAAMAVADALGIGPCEPSAGRIEDDPILRRLEVCGGRVRDLCHTVASEVVLLAA